MPLPHQRAGPRRPSLHRPEHSNLQRDRARMGSAHATGIPVTAARERQSILQVPGWSVLATLGLLLLALQRRWGKPVPDKLLFTNEQCLNHAPPPLCPQDSEGEESPKPWKGVWRPGCWGDCHTLSCCCCFWYLFLYWPFWHSKEQTKEMPECNKRLREISWKRSAHVQVRILTEIFFSNNWTVLQATEIHSI